LAILRRTSSISGIFTLPNEKMFKRVYNARLKPILDTDSIFNPPMEIQPVRRMDLVQIYDSFGYITGCTEGDATSISADFLFHDELDLSPMNMIALFQSRLQDSDMKMTQAFSTPSFVDYGINNAYMKGDQREYMLQCPSCNHWQIPTFDMRSVHIPDFKIEVSRLTDITSQQINELPLDQIYVKCERCQSRLDLNDASHREWVATHPNRTAFRSYKVRPFSTARIPPGYIFTQLSQYQDQDYLRGFYNTVLGEPFTESSAQIQRSEI
jgi:phage terminase large subunit GpA-like protein